VDVAVHENRPSVVVGTSTSLGASDRVINGCLSTGFFQQVPEAWDELAVGAGAIGSGRQIDAASDGTPQAGRQIAEQVVADPGVVDDFVHRGPESFEEKRVAVEIVVQQLRAAIAVGQAEHGGFPAQCGPVTGNTDLENSGDPI
jgi:hypothetical protein